MIIAGAGPAGSMAALVLARAGARVVVVDRSTAPGSAVDDTLNPGAVRLLRAWLPSSDLPAGGWPIHGLRLTTAAGTFSGHYRAGASGLVLSRRLLDAALLDAAVAAGARFEGGLIVRRPLVDAATGLVRGLVFVRPGRPGEIRMPSVLSIGADGRRSALATRLGLRRDVWPPRWAVRGRLHGRPPELGDETVDLSVRHGGMLSLTPTGRGQADVWAVTGQPRDERSAVDLLRREMAAHAALDSRLRGTAIEGPVRIVGPLGTRVTSPAVPGLLLAGDAAIATDPLTGDGVHLALRTGLLAGEEALRTLEDGQVHAAVWRLAAAHRRQLGSKLRFNRWLCRVAASSAAAHLARHGLRLFPDLVDHAVSYAGDVA